MAHAIEALLTTLHRLMNGHTDRQEEAQMLTVLAEIEAAKLNEVLMQPDFRHLLKSVDDRVIGPNNRTALYDLLTVRRLADLQVKARVALVNALQKGLTSTQQEEAICNIFLGTCGSDLTALKNEIDAGDDYRDLQQLIFSDIDDHEIRTNILSHIQREGNGNRCSAMKVLSDIDDTFYATLHGQRYPRDTTYPGVIQYYNELIHGLHTDPNHRGALVFLTARPKDRLGVVEGYTKHALSKRSIEEDFTVLSGDLLHLTKKSDMAAKKYENFVQYRQLFPEYGFVFTGDSGQGDAIFGAKIKADFPEDVRGVFIHDVTGCSSDRRASWHLKGVVFFDTYVGAAVEGYKCGLISRVGIQRVISAARRELQAIAFTSAQQKGEREVDLDKDIALARALA